jgi:hypothetical protein
MQLHDLVATVHFQFLQFLIEGVGHHHNAQAGGLPQPPR